MDLVTTTQVRPKVGETVLGNNFSMIPGGKGANQAVAAARLGAEVTLIGRVGDDSFGALLTQHLEKEGVKLSNSFPLKDKGTGIASIIVSEGDNSIIVVPGANTEVTPEYVTKFEKEIAGSDIVLVQLEIPISAVEVTVQLATKHKVPVILNPAPMQLLSETLLQQISYITPNETEAKELEELTGGKHREKLITTMGKKGASFWRDNQWIKVDSFSVDLVDSTGAGDSFNGALAVALSEGRKLDEACQFAVAAGALAVTKLGAQSGMPMREELTQFLERQ